MFILNIYIYCLYPDVPINCDDIAEVEDMLNHHFHQK